MDRLMLVSSDCHWGDAVPQYRNYMDSKHLGAFDDLLKELAAKGGLLNLENIFGDLDEATKEAAGFDHMDQRNDFSGAMDNPTRLKALEADGVVGEVIFPNLVVPFSTSFAMNPTEYPVELQLAGQRAYNRALADFIDKDRQVGLALISYLDIEEAVKEVRWARRAGLGGILVGSVTAGLPVLGADPYYDPLWAVCVNEGMPVHFHGGAGAPLPSTPTEFATLGSIFSFTVESVFYGHRALWYMIGGGALERFSELKIVFTELGSDWIMRGLDFMDHVWGKDTRFSLLASKLLPKAPSEYWHRQGYVGASMMSHAEMALRGRLGVDKMMFGTDFPHGEGTWGKTTSYVRALCLEGKASEAEARAILGETAVEFYGLPRAKLQAIANRVGPSLEDVIDASAPLLTDPHHLSYLNRPAFAA